MTARTETALFDRIAGFLARRRERARLLPLLRFDDRRLADLGISRRDLNVALFGAPAEGASRFLSEARCDRVCATFGDAA